MRVRGGVEERLHNVEKNEERDQDHDPEEEEAPEEEVCTPSIFFWHFKYVCGRAPRLRNRTKSRYLLIYSNK